jgi:hypothetical protein
MSHYRCYRCKAARAEFTFEPCDRCGFDGPDKRWWWSRIVDWMRLLWLELANPPGWLVRVCRGRIDNLSAGGSDSTGKGGGGRSGAASPRLVAVKKQCSESHDTRTIL